MNEVRLRRRARKKIPRGVRLGGEWGSVDAGVQRGECKQTRVGDLSRKRRVLFAFFAVPLTMLLSSVLGVSVVIARRRFG